MRTNRIALVVAAALLVAMSLVGFVVAATVAVAEDEVEFAKANGE
jgi:hypothetical protein